MLWRVGGGTSRRLSIPRDTVVPIPGPRRRQDQRRLRVRRPRADDQDRRAAAPGVEDQPRDHRQPRRTSPKFINAIGGVDVKTGRICSEISGGVKNGGFTLNLRPGTHHLNGTQALTLARTRENRCNPAENDLTREKRQQQILNAIKSQLTVAVARSSACRGRRGRRPRRVRTDMGGFTMLSLFAAVRDGRLGADPRSSSRPARRCSPAASDALTVSQPAVNRAVDRLMGR